MNRTAPNLQRIEQRNRGRAKLLGPYAIAAVSKDGRLQSSKLVDPVVTRHIALVMPRQGNLTLACRTAMQVAREIEIVKSSTAGCDVHSSCKPDSRSI